MHKDQSLQAGHLPLEHLFFLQNLLNFIITKYLKQEVDDDLSICVDERSPCGLCITRDVTLSKGNDVTTPYGEVPYGPLSRCCFYCPNLITVETKRFVKLMGL